MYWLYGTMSCGAWHVCRMKIYDNNSKDKTAQIAKENGAIVVPEYKQGKGNVVRSMFSDIDADYYIMVDGDDTYPAEFVHQLIEPVREGKANISKDVKRKDAKSLGPDWYSWITESTLNFVFLKSITSINSFSA